MNVGEDDHQVLRHDHGEQLEGYDADDKFFQINAASTLNVTNCINHRPGYPGERPATRLRRGLHRLVGQLHSIR